MRSVDVIRALVAALVLVGSAGAARADGTNREVERLLQEGRTLRLQDQPERALDVFRKAHALEPSARTLGQMGLAEAQIAIRAGRLGSPAGRLWEAADEHLSAALAAPDSAWLRKYRTALQDELAKVRQHTGELQVRGTEGAVVYVAGIARGTLPLPAPLRVGEGEANLQVTAPGRQPFITTIRLLPGQVLRVEALLEPRGAPAPRAQIPVTQQSGAPSQGIAPRADTYSAKSWSSGRVAGWTLVAGGAVMAGSGGVLLMIDKNETCQRMPGELCNQRSQTRLGGWGLIGAGVVAGIVGGLVLYSSSSGEVALNVAPSAIVLAGRF